MLAYHHSSKNGNKEELELYCGTQCGILAITDNPSGESKCDEHYLGNIWAAKEELFAELDIIFMLSV